MSTIQIRIDEKTKRSAKKVLDELGLDMSSAIKLYLKQISVKKGIPFPLVTENGFTPAEEAEILRSSNETLKEYKAGKLKGYTSTKEMMKDLMS